MSRRIKDIPFIVWRRLRLLLPVPLSRAMSNLAIELLHSFRHIVGVRRIQQLQRTGRPISQLELAGGNRESDTFVNVGWGTKYPIDLRRSMPFGNSTIDRIYSSHFLEHLSPRELKFLLRECSRILKPGGQFEAALPNTVETIIRYADYARGVISHYELNIDSSQYQCATDKLVYSVFVIISI